MNKNVEYNPNSQNYPIRVTINGENRQSFTIEQAEDIKNELEEAIEQALKDRRISMDESVF